MAGTDTQTNHVSNKQSACHRLASCKTATWLPPDSQPNLNHNFDFLTSIRLLSLLDPPSAPTTRSNATALLASSLDLLLLALLLLLLLLDSLLLPPSPLGLALLMTQAASALRSTKTAVRCLKSIP